LDWSRAGFKPLKESVVFADASGIGDALDKRDLAKYDDSQSRITQTWMLKVN